MTVADTNTKYFACVFELESCLGNGGITAPWPRTDLKLEDTIVNSNLVTSALKVEGAVAPSEIMRVCSMEVNESKLPYGEKGKGYVDGEQK